MRISGKNDFEVFTCKVKSPSESTARSSFSHQYVHGIDYAIAEEADSADSR